MSLSGMLLLALAQPTAGAPPLIPSFFTGEALYEICRQPNAGQCSMYVAGVTDGIFSVSPFTDRPLLCPARVNNQEAAELVLRFLQDNPDMRPKAAAVAINEALADTLSCN